MLQCALGAQIAANNCPPPSPSSGASGGGKVRKGKAPFSVKRKAPYNPPGSVEMVVGHACDLRSRPGATTGRRSLGMRSYRSLCRPKNALVGHGGNVQPSRGIVATPPRRDYANAVVMYLGGGREQKWGSRGQRGLLIRGTRQATRGAHAQEPPPKRRYAPLIRKPRIAGSQEMTYGRLFQRHLNHFDLPTVLIEWAHQAQDRAG